MKPLWIGVGLVALAATGVAAYSYRDCLIPGQKTGSHTKTTAAATSSGGANGKFDPMMAGCQFSCAAKEEHLPSEVVAQPGVKSGQYTQCPVSGVVFAVDAERPRVQVALDDYVVCCEQCAEKLRAEPKKFLNL